MLENELSDEYLSNFPTVFQEALTENVKVRTKFLKTAIANYDDLQVYRAICCEDRIVEKDFWSYVEIAILNNDEYNRNSLAWYSVSVNEDKNQLIANMHIPNEERQLLGIATGMMKCQYGPADFDEKKTHHNWYLYKGAGELLIEEFMVEKIENMELKESGIKKEIDYREVERM